MLTRALGLGESSGRLDHDLRADRLPVQVRRILFGKDLQLLVADVDRVIGGGDVLFEVAEHRVVLQEMCQGFGVSKVVDGYEFDFRMIERGAHYVAADATEPVNPDFDCHSVPLLCMQSGKYEIVE